MKKTIFMKYFNSEVMLDLLLNGFLMKDFFRKIEYCVHYLVYTVIKT